MSIASGSLSRMKTLKKTAMKMVLWLSCSLLARCSTNSSRNQSARDPSAPRPCVVLQPDSHLGVVPPEGGGVGWQWDPARAQGSITVTQGCMLTVWTEQGGHQTFPSGTQVHLKGWEWTSKPLAFHCSCEMEDVPNPVYGAYENFIQQHVDPKTERGDEHYCRVEMAKINKRNRCKAVNTFIHACIKDVTDVCITTEALGKQKCHLSKNSFKQTECRKLPKKSCQYKFKNFQKPIKIVCRDNKPVHFCSINP
ncbi:uncharacterized protein LOC133125292 isoform X2 [Conger conger]|uniref:uncharacterized protein LOC133125292 isoform X2 n=1 Tax=Conger conger TaxID=82655 RepID=UPI002A5A63F7|nr:uncharacterized protein LOC133125292 isoform X2 [Conger conger]